MSIPTTPPREPQAPVRLHSTVYPQQKKKPHKVFQTVHDTGKNVYKGYDFLANAPVLREIRVFVEVTLPVAAKGFSKMAKPMQYLHGVALIGAVGAAFKTMKYLKLYRDVAGDYKTEITLKACIAFSRLVENLEKAVLTSEAFGWTARLADKGYKLTASAIKVAASWSFYIGTFVWMLDFARIAVNIYKIDRRTLEIAFLLDAVEGVNDPQQKLETLKQARFFEGYHNERLNVQAGFSDHRIKKTYHVNPTEMKNWMKQLTMEQLKGETDAEKVDNLVKTLRSRIEGRVEYYRGVLLSETINIIATPIIFTSFLHPLGYVLLGMSSAVGIGNYIHEKYGKYRFQHEIGLRVEPEGFYARIKHIAACVLLDGGKKIHKHSS